jgi:hypothetical protein
MTEAQWNESTEPQKMLLALRASGRASDRKLRLFTCACCRLIWDFPNDERPRRVLEVAERYADGLATSGEIFAAFCDVRNCLLPLGRRYTHKVPAEVLDSAFIAFARTASTGAGYYGAKWEYAVHDAVQCAGDAAGRVARVAAWPGDDIAATHRVEAALLRCIFGPLAFRKLPPVAPAVLARNGGMVGRLAAGVYEARDFTQGRLGVLADAADEAGLLDAELLAHLRSPGLHARGCHAVDLLLGRE